MFIIFDSKISRQKQRKAVKRSADFYGNLRKELAAQGPIQAEYSQATEVNISGVWKRWNRYSQDVNQRPINFLKSAVAGDYMAFFTWVLDRYPRVRKKSSVHQYWRQLKMLYKKYAGRLLDKDLVDNVNNYINVLKRQYKLETSVRDKPVLSVDDLLLVLHHHWVLDTWVYPDEEQRLLLALLFLFAAYTGSRPCSLVDASVKKLDNRASNTVEDEAASPCDSGYEDDEYDSEYRGELEYDEDGLPFADADMEELKSILYEHVTILAVKVKDRSVLVMFITVIHTKGEDRKPQPKTYKVYQHSNPFLCPIAYMIAVGLHNNAFAASKVRDPEKILRARIPTRKFCRIFRWKESKLKEPIFREPERSKGQVLSSAKTAVPLRAHTAGRYMKRLGRDVGMEQPLSQSCIRRATGNAVDDVATVAERDQIMGHGYSGVFQFYINPRVKCDVQAAYLDQPSDKALMKVLGNMSLTYDPLAPTGPTPEDARAIQQHPKIVKLRQRRDALTAKIKQIRRRAGPCADAEEEEELLQQKKEAEAALRRKKKSLRDRAEKKARERYFMDNDTRELEEESDSLLNDKDKGKSTTITYALEERACIADMLCRSHGDLTEPGNLNQRIELIRTLTKLCSRREARRRSTIPCSSGAVVKQEDVAVLSSLPLECDPRQCLFCIGDERLPIPQRTFCWSRPAKMMDHIEDHHLKRFAPNAKIPCPHPTCQKNGVVLDGVSHFKNHALSVHKIKLRLPKVESF
ncbi:hypothetical protein K469DRAFT_698544 [Zopfia rhizophila CBS 207.26]|uniref:FluG domain-containing protein n=1 Tax=Zopfia rhizophila CBS 207.26 TaxID=1314779 RepID=A0A6A6EXW8_9PEZI|nr:hypothetical protein K469DRAFT_698544 [Zopfia rhizophila CBS 207.26]